MCFGHTRRAYHVAVAWWAVFRAQTHLYGAAGASGDGPPFWLVLSLRAAASQVRDTLLHFRRRV